MTDETVTRIFRDTLDENARLRDTSRWLKIFLGLSLATNAIFALASILRF